MLVHNILNKIYYRQIRQKIRQNTQRLTFRIPQKNKRQTRIVFDGFDRKSHYLFPKETGPERGLRFIFSAWSRPLRR